MFWISDQNLYLLTLIIKDLIGDLVVTSNENHQIPHLKSFVFSSQWYYLNFEIDDIQILIFINQSTFIEIQIFWIYLILPY